MAWKQASLPPQPLTPDGEWIGSSQSDGGERRRTVTCGQPEASPHLRIGRLTRCANRSSKRRVRQRREAPACLSQPECLHSATPVIPGAAAPCSSLITRAAKRSAASAPAPPAPYRQSKRHGNHGNRDVPRSGGMGWMSVLKCRDQCKGHGMLLSGIDHDDRSRPVDPWPPR